MRNLSSDTGGVDGWLACNQVTLGTRVVCPKFGHPVQNSDIYLKPQLLHGKNNFVKIVNGLLVLKSFQISNDDYIFFLHAHSG